MTKDLNTTGRWLKRLKQLLAVLREAGERGLVDSDALTMLEGVLEGGDLQVRDIMVPRAQMVFVRRDSEAAPTLPVVVEPGHWCLKVMAEYRDHIAGSVVATFLLRRTRPRTR